MKIEIQTKFDIGDMVFVKSEVTDLRKKALQIHAIEAFHASSGIRAHNKIKYHLAISGNEYIGFDYLVIDQGELVSEKEGIEIRKSMVNGGEQ